MNLHQGHAKSGLLKPGLSSVAGSLIILLVLDALAHLGQCQVIGKYFVYE